MSKVKIILGIDPGTNVMGYGLIKVEGSELTLIEFSDISLKKYDDHYLKLKYIFSGLTEIIEKYNPDEIAIEAPFFGKNVQSMLKLGRAQGVAMAAGLVKEIPKNLDATDGLADALCHYYNSNSNNKIDKKYSSWSSYLKNNPEKKL